MEIHELISNATFSFNVPFRILKYVGRDRTKLIHDSTKPNKNDVPFDIMMKHITAINTGDDGVVEIEYCD